MGRKAKISKEQMLCAGLKIVIRDGHEGVSMKALAEELGCSTHPIAWAFGNIDNFKTELRRFAMAYMQRKMLGEDLELVDNHRHTGNVYIDMAIDEPNLIRYLRSDEVDLRAMGGIGFVFEEERNKELGKRWSNILQTSEGNAFAFMQFVTVYTEGIVSMILSGVIQLDKETAHCMLDEAGAAYMLYLKTKDGRREGYL